ncbi:MAG: hypothetical protein LBL18_05160 [Bacteroidales bacterium]|jgi:membrane protease YdiL (CAAX protease family)|nr:hypothetical protein [Bacteroidales bacterium]
MTDLDFKRLQLLYEQNNLMIQEIFHSRERTVTIFLIIISGFATFVTACIEKNWSNLSISFALFILLLVSIASTIVEYWNKIYSRKLYDNGKELEKLLALHSTITGPILFFANMYKGKWYKVKKNKSWISVFIFFYGIIGLLAFGSLLVVGFLQIK